MDYQNGIRDYLQREIEIINSLDTDEISDAINAIKNAGKRGATIWVMGNGGSSATASHMVCDFTKGVYCSKEKNRYDFRCLSDNTPIFSAIANDLGYDEVFVYQLRDILSPNDLIIAISGSGNSENVIRAIKYAKEIGTPVIGITGYDGGTVRKLSDHHMHAPVNDMQISEDIHIIFDHMVMRLLCEE